MPAAYQCAIVTPERQIFSDAVEYMVLPGSDGEMGVLIHHAPTITTLKPGRVRIRREGSSDTTDTFVVSGGYAQIEGEIVNVLANRAVNVSDIDEQDVKSQIAQLESQVDALDKEDTRLAYLQGQLDWARVQLEAVS